MASSSLLSPNPLVNSDRSSIQRKRKKRIEKGCKNQTQNFHSISATQWRSEAQQQIYSSKLLRALHQVRHGGGSASVNQVHSSKQVRDAAKKVLATTAKGRSRWSRAIISSRLTLKRLVKKNVMAKRQSKVFMTVIPTGSSRLQKISRLKSNSLPDFQRKARVLGRLVPGCRKQPLQVVLEETADYIPALEMQVRAMSSLLELLSANGSSSISMVPSNGLGSN